MIPSSRIRVVRPPPNREDLRSSEGRVISLIPFASDPLRYKIELKKSDGSEELEILEMAANSIQLVDYDDDDDGTNNKKEEMLVVNDLCYCKDHRLEICGKCGYNFRSTNLMYELDGDTSRAFELDEQLQRIGASIRRAPSKGGTETKPYDLYTPIVNDAVVGIPSGLNVINLDDFPRDKFMVNSFHSQFSLDMYGTQMEEQSVRPLYRVRSIFTEIGDCLDSAIQDHKALPRIFLQDSAQSEVLNMDIVAIKLLVGDHVSGVKWRLPIIVVAWSHVNAGDRAGLLASISTMQPGTPMSEILASTPEIGLMAKILQVNASNISTDALTFLRERVMPKNPALQIGIIAPISTKADEEYYNLLGNFCDLCSASECKLFRCSRCRSVQYCSKACQKISWKKHKVKCKSL